MKDGFFEPPPFDFEYKNYKTNRDLNTSKFNMTLRNMKKSKTMRSSLKNDIKKCYFHC